MLIAHFTKLLVKMPLVTIQSNEPGLYSGWGYLIQGESSGEVRFRRAIALEELSGCLIYSFVSTAPLVRALCSLKAAGVVQINFLKLSFLGLLISLLYVVRFVL